MFGLLKEYRNVQRVINARYDVLFYAENAYYFQYFKHLFESLKSRGVKICYITSDKSDPVFQQSTNFITVVYSNRTLAFAFQNLKANVMIMTMPDLQNFIFKRSA